MAPWILFDVLLTAMVLLIVPLGFWRGGIKEAVLGGSILVGHVLGNAFAVRWGPGVAELMGRRDAVGATVVAESLLWGSVLVLGYLGGATIPRAGQSLAGRIAGAIIGLFNGLLLLGFTLRFINILLLGQEPDRWTEAGLIASVLSRGTVELLLLAAVCLSIGVIAALLARVFGAWDPQNDLLAADAQHGAASRAWPATPPTPRVSYEQHREGGVKIEPEHALPQGLSTLEFGPASSRLARLDAASQKGSTGDGDVSRQNQFEPPRASSPGWTEDGSDAAEPPADGAHVVSEWLRRGPRPERPQDRSG